MVWAILTWFLFRHWQENHGEYKAKLDSTIRSQAERNWYVKHIVRKAANQSSETEYRIQIETFQKQSIGREWKASYIATKTTEAPNNNAEKKYYVFRGWRGRLSMAFVKLQFSLAHGFIVAYWTPYALCIIAILLGFSDWLKPVQPAAISATS